MWSGIMYWLTFCAFIHLVFLHQCSVVALCRPWNHNHSWWSVVSDSVKSCLHLPSLFFLPYSTFCDSTLMPHHLRVPFQTLPPASHCSLLPHTKPSPPPPTVTSASPSVCVHLTCSCSSCRPSPCTLLPSVIYFSPCCFSKTLQQPLQLSNHETILPAAPPRLLPLLHLLKHDNLLLPLLIFLKYHLLILPPHARHTTRVFDKSSLLVWRIISSPLNQCPFIPLLLLLPLLLFISSPPPAATLDGRLVDCCVQMTRVMMGSVVALNRFVSVFCLFWLYTSSCVCVCVWQWIKQLQCGRGLALWSQRPFHGKPNELMH